jgi:hypothetical protein
MRVQRRSHPVPPAPIGYAPSPHVQFHVLAAMGDFADELRSLGRSRIRPRRARRSLTQLDEDPVADHDVTYVLIKSAATPPTAAPAAIPAGRHQRCRREDCWPRASWLAVALRRNSRPPAGAAERGSFAGAKSRVVGRRWLAPAWGSPHFVRSGPLRPVAGGTGSPAPSIARRPWASAHVHALHAVLVAGQAPPASVPA